MTIIKKEFSAPDAAPVILYAKTDGNSNLASPVLASMFSNSVGTTLGSGEKTVTTAGTRVALAAATPCMKVYICANSANTGKIYYGGAAVSATSGAYLFAGATLLLEISDLSSIYLDSDVNGEGVQYTYVA
jgi:hypothetical protein